MFSGVTYLRDIWNRNIAAMLGTGPFAASAAPAGAVDLTARVEIPAMFPPLMDPGTQAAKIVDVMALELKRAGTTLGAAKTIHVAYPHKHPGKFAHHPNPAGWYVTDVIGRLRQYRPKINWVRDDGLCETVHLDRSGRQDSIHALTGRQVYVVDETIQKEDAPFARPDGRPDYFIIVDQCVEQGTTVANLMSYIANRGGKVLLAVAGDTPLAQDRTRRPPAPAVTLSGAFNDAARNTGRLVELGAVMARAAQKEGRDHTPQECLERLDSALRRHGNSVLALTNGECQRLINSMTGWYGDENLGFTALIDGLEAAPRAVAPVWSPVSRGP